MGYSRFAFYLLLFAFCPLLGAQTPPGYWQQRVEYQLDVRLDDQTHAVQGREKLKYFNNSPDTLRRVFFHLYWNSIQPNSAYAKWAQRMADATTNRRFMELQPYEIGKMEIFTVLQNGSAVSYRINETIMEVELSRPLMPNDYDVFDIAWQGQVPVNIERGGRNSADDVAYSFTQWYPKMCVYDGHGWHANPHVGREFFGNFGSFKVNITLPKKYIVAATGILKNADIIGYGYENKGAKPVPNYGLVNVWKFEADNVHDFAWAADPEYVHDKIKMRDDLTLHFLYQPSSKTTPAFKAVQKFVAENFNYIEANFGKYLYPQFTFAQGGKWAMEYPMLTLIETGSESDITGTAVHELMHNWFYGMMGNNELDEHWLDEGFASYATSDILSHTSPDSAAKTRRNNFAHVVQTAPKLNDPISTPANYFAKDEWYFFNAYSKAEAFLWQLRYIVGEEAFRRGMLHYHANWHFKHPSGNDFLRSIERASSMELDWFYAGWIKTLHTIDYGVETPQPDGATASKITLKNLGTLPMPVEVLIEFKDGASELHYVPLDLQYGSKKFPAGMTIVAHEPWSFSVDTYEIRLEKPVTSIKSVTIDPDAWTADTNRKNNHWEF